MKKNHQKMAWFGLWLIQRCGNTLMQCGQILLKTLGTFVLAMDGMNPFGEFNFKHSTWLDLLLMYNLFPWLVAKQICYVVSCHPWKGISQGCKYGHIHGTFD
jgi:hypothetical protein